MKITAQARLDEVREQPVDATRSRLVDLLEPVLRQCGAELEDLTVQRAGRRFVVRVVADRDGGVSLDEVAEISRAASAVLDEAEQREPALLPGSYVLEVGSPGVDRPLTAPRHWQRNRGRLVRAVARDGRELVGRVVAADASTDATVLLDVEGEQVRLPYAELIRGEVQLEFSRPAEDGERA